MSCEGWYDSLPLSTSPWKLCLQWPIICHLLNQTENALIHRLVDRLLLLSFPCHSLQQGTFMYECTVAKSLSLRPQVWRHLPADSGRGSGWDVHHRHRLGLLWYHSWLNCRSSASEHLLASHQELIAGDLLQHEWKQLGLEAANCRCFLWKDWALGPH